MPTVNEITKMDIGLYIVLLFLTCVLRITYSLLIDKNAIKEPFPCPCMLNNSKATSKYVYKNNLNEMLAHKFFLAYGAPQYNRK